LLALGALIDGANSDTTYVHGCLRAAVGDADALLDRLMHPIEDLIIEHNQAKELILERVVESDEFKAAVSAVSDERVEHARFERGLANIVAHTAERGLWLGVALAHRFFVESVR
jgi:hypothetical protein